MTRVLQSTHPSLKDTKLFRTFSPVYHGAYGRVKRYNHGLISKSTKKETSSQSLSSSGKKDKVLYAEYESGEALPDTYEHIDPAKSKHRRAGVVLHPTSLPGRYGTGEIGNEALKFVDWLVDAGVQVWQVLPLVPPDPLYWSPYSGEDALCGNTLLIPLDGLVHMGLLDSKEADEAAAMIAKEDIDASSVNFTLAKEIKGPLLRKAALKLLDDSSLDDLRSSCDVFRSKNSWVEESALFHALCQDPDLADCEAWWDWPEKIRDRHTGTLAQLKSKWADEIEIFVVLQFLFDTFWSGVKDYASARGVTIVGDMPIYVGGHSADVWANRKLFQLDQSTGKPALVSGVPPDAFSATGQLWGSPLYDWKANEAEGYSWWIQRMKRAMDLYDETRIDHFRAFAGYWAVEAWRDTAMIGQWQKGPGLSLFNALRRELGDVPILAEDLGVITEDVIQLRDMVGAPGMLVLQFAWGGGPRNTHLPHNARPNSFIYTGTHDNPTTVEWWESQATDEEKQIIHDYCGIDIENGDIVATFTKLAFASVSKTAILTMQDVLRLGAEARMNTPGRAEGNWTWRLGSDALTLWESEAMVQSARELREWIRVTDRLSSMHKKME
jgi:4-alpha-glucanotransferase